MSSVHSTEHLSSVSKYARRVLTQLKCYFQDIAIKHQPYLLKSQDIYEFI
ncbi:hypothetical protein GJV44_00356 [Candidatus Vallotia cooleyia]|nr:hypothetical protein GJV44_00356 [Candidatus Vallotia cooleyia]